MAKPTLDFDALLQEESNRPGLPLRVDIVLAQLPPDQRAKVERALMNRAVKRPHISRALERLGHSVSHCAISNWRAKHLV